MSDLDDIKQRRQDRRDHRVRVFRGTVVLDDGPMDLFKQLKEAEGDLYRAIEIAEGQSVDAEWAAEGSKRLVEEFKRVTNQRDEARALADYLGNFVYAVRFMSGTTDGTVRDAIAAYEARKWK